MKNYIIIEGLDQDFNIVQEKIKIPRKFKRMYRLKIKRHKMKTITFFISEECKKEKPLFTEAVGSDYVAILKDGVEITINEILKELNK